jgi:crotonobetainyl-CoA:carnitine CoA-transferase CaiB-like acyl-CoA transferase
MQTGCNKRSLALNFRAAGAAEVVRRLVTTADVVVVNLPPAALRKMGLDWETVHGLNNKTILCTQTAFGSHGPLANKGGFDGVAQAMSGAMYMTGTPGQPVKSAAPYVDFSTAVMSAMGVLAALLSRQQTGLGQHVESSLLGTAMAVFGSHLAEQGALAVGREPSGNRVQTSGPSDVFATRDGHILTHVVGNGLFRRCAGLLGHAEWLERPELLSDQGRGDARDELCEAMAAWCGERSTEAALEALQAAGIPAGPVLDLQQALDQPQVAAMRLFQNLGFPGFEGTAPVVDMPLRFSAGKAGIRQRPPTLGEHNQELLKELGFTDEEIAALDQ